MRRSHDTATGGKVQLPVSTVAAPFQVLDPNTGRTVALIQSINGYGVLTLLGPDGNAIAQLGGVPAGANQPEGNTPGLRLFDATSHRPAVELLAEGSEVGCAGVLRLNDEEGKTAAEMTADHQGGSVALHIPAQEARNVARLDAGEGSGELVITDPRNPQNTPRPSVRLGF